MEVNTQVLPVVAEQGLADASTAISVVCLCAAWCGVCRQYQPEFEALQAKFPQLRFAWLDVEDEEALMGEVDVETFPTLLIGQGAQAVFFGPLLPQIKVLERLIENALETGVVSSGVAVQAHALWRRIAEKLQ